MTSSDEGEQPVIRYDSFIDLQRSSVDRHRSQIARLLRVLGCVAHQPAVSRGKWAPCVRSLCNASGWGCASCWARNRLLLATFVGYPTCCRGTRGRTKVYGRAWLVEWGEQAGGHVVEPTRSRRQTKLDLSFSSRHGSRRSGRCLALETARPLTPRKHETLCREGPATLRGTLLVRGSIRNLLFTCS